jgi:glucokinase
MPAADLPPRTPRGADQLLVGVDIGGTSIKLGLITAAGELVARSSLPTQASQGPAAAIRRIAETLRTMLADSAISPDDLRCVGLGAPGRIDAELGTIDAPANLAGWAGFPFCDAFLQQFGRPARLFNDATAAAYGEFWVGVGRPFRSIVLLTLGTGVGGGVIVDGRPLTGEHGFGAELGHVLVAYNDQARLCSCGQRGHLEAYAGASAVVMRTREALARGRCSSLVQRIDAGEQLSPALIADEAQQGDVLARQMVFETASLIGVGVATALHAFDPGIVILGGAMTFGGAASELGRWFIETVREEARRRALAPLVATPIEFATLGGDAGLIGAAGLARDFDKI